MSLFCLFQHYNGRGKANYFRLVLKSLGLITKKCSPAFSCSVYPYLPMLSTKYIQTYMHLFNYFLSFFPCNTNFSDLAMGILQIFRYTGDLKLKIRKIQLSIGIWPVFICLMLNDRLSTPNPQSINIFSTSK